ncbi:MAG: 3'-5' exonuclease [Bacteroidales bacterium]|nr:3'-5' exonuclease [Bacteroidales bacterium]MBN2750482.1 3'-5' exonuclease [Bacteroidales bacterium]
MLNHVSIEDVLFLDIETVPQFSNYSNLPVEHKALWNKKAVSLTKDPQVDTPEQVYQRAGIYAEFGKVVCISAGMVVSKEGQRYFRVKSFAGADERLLLEGFSVMLNRFGARNTSFLCAHNGKEFDFPFIARRMLINGLPIPPMLDVAGKKPWEVPFLDTMELWKFGDYKHYTSLSLLAYVFGIPTPKDDIDGSQVANVFYNENDVERIAVYCEKDTLTVAQLLLKYKGEPLIEAENIERVQN